MINAAMRAIDASPRQKSAENIRPCVRDHSRFEAPTPMSHEPVDPSQNRDQHHVSHALVSVAYAKQDRLRRNANHDASTERLDLLLEITAEHRLLADPRAYRKGHPRRDLRDPSREQRIDSLGSIGA